MEGRKVTELATARLRMTRNDRYDRNDRKKKLPPRKKREKKLALKHFTGKLKGAVGSD